MIDIKLLLDELGVDYKEGGKNVGASDINVDCPYCGWEKHLSINVATGKVWCWVCEFSDEKRRPYLIPVLWKLTELSWGEIVDAAKEHGWEFNFVDEAPKEDDRRTTCYLPEGTLTFLEDSKARDIAFKYLEDRGFDEYTIVEYKLRFAKTGYYKNRIIIPIYKDDKLVTFTSRKFRGESGSRYRHAPVWASVERIKHLLYNFDTAKQYRKIYLLEGPSDVWRMGPDSVAVFRSNLSRIQRNLLLEGGFSDITIIYDPNATGRAYKAASDLSIRVPNIKVVRLGGDMDVADLDREDVLDIESETPKYRG